MGTTAAARVTIADALFSRTQQRVLGILFGEPQRSFFVNEIFQRAGSGRGSVQRELQRLLASGLITVRQVGNQKHYQANEASPVFRELRSIVLKTTRLVDPLLAALRPLRRQIELAFVYGSVARGEETAASDVDLLVVSDDLLLEQLLAALEKAEREVGRPIHPTLYTRAEFSTRRKNNAFVRKVLAGPVMPLMGSVDAESTTR
ncbi:MAG TPA: winged helix-turn-helix domain-containing protein [Thermoanaerobaculia bacterium]|nr:winged helix-turn-helix domain-containing protein [Thermoanaerobaculia bacterium]